MGELGERGAHIQTTLRGKESRMEAMLAQLGFKAHVWSPEIEKWDYIFEVT